MPPGKIRLGTEKVQSPVPPCAALLEGGAAKPVLSTVVVAVWQPLLLLGAPRSELRLDVSLLWYTEEGRETSASNFG